MDEFSSFVFEYNECSVSIHEEISRQFLQEWNDFTDKNDVHEWILNIIKNNGQIYVMVDKNNNELMGTVGIQYNEKHIDVLLVSTAYRHHGYGKLLLRFAENQLKKKNASDVSLYCYDHLCDFYMNLGWQMTGTMTRLDNGLLAHVLHKKM